MSITLLILNCDILKKEKWCEGDYIWMDSKEEKRL